MGFFDGLKRENKQSHAPEAGPSPLNQEPEVTQREEQPSIEPNIDEIEVTIRERESTPFEVV